MTNIYENFAEATKVIFEWDKMEKQWVCFTDELPTSRYYGDSREDAFQNFINSL